MSASGGLNELGFYALAGNPESPRELMIEAQEAERLGLGAAFISERFDFKEAATLSGALAAVTTRLGIATAPTNHYTRHPIVTASHAMTMHKLTGGRYTLGLGRGFPGQTTDLGVGTATSAKIADFAWLMRRLWAGETIVDHEGPAGRFQRLSLEMASREHIPMTITAFGPKSLALGGRVFDSVVLHPFFTNETTKRAVEVVRLAAESTGRDPSSVRIWSVLPIVGDQVPVDMKRRRVVGRLATYLQSYGELLASTNGWDPAVLERFRQDLFVKSFRGPIDGRASDSEIDHVAGLLPDAWLVPAASGSTAECVSAIRGQFDLGVDGVILQGASPWELEATITGYRRVREADRFTRLKRNPGSIARVR